jgi:predicted RND superfamily exporter protein
MSLERFPERLARVQHERPWPALAVGALVSLASLPFIIGVPGFVDGLTLNSDFTAMLPETAPSVRDLDEIQRRFGGQQAMTLVIEADDIDAVHRFTRELAPRIEAMDEHKVVAVDWNISDMGRFVEEHRHLYAELDDLTELRDVLRARADYERARANPFFLDLEDEEPPDPQPLARRMQREAERERRRVERRFPEGFLQHPRRNLVIVVVHTRIRGGVAPEIDALKGAIEAEVAQLRPSYPSDLRVHYGGTLMEVREETESLISAVRDATLLTISLVMLGIFVFFLRLRPIPLLSIALVPPVLLTFAFAELTVDYLNASSAFLSAIVVGNGINPSIIWLARYFEERRAGVDPKQALVVSHRGTWKGTLTASLAASLAYVSLMSTDYRGFRDFGIVGGSGMVFCWLATYLLLPSLVVVIERWRPLSFKRTSGMKNIYGLVFARLAINGAWPVVVISSVMTIATSVFVVWAVMNDPMEYDFRRLRSDRPPGSDVEFVLEATRPILDDTMSGSALAVLANSREDAQYFVRTLEEERERLPRTYGQVESIDDLLPKDQEQKIAVLRDLRELMTEMRPHVNERLGRVIDEQLPPEHIAVLTPDDLPHSVARPFTEHDGTRGRIVFVEHNEEESSFDGLYLTRWAGAARSLRAPDGDAPPVAGVAMVFSDLMETIWRDGPRAVGIAFIAVVLLLIVTFRQQKERWLTLASLLVGVLWMAGVMGLLDMRLNFLNFVAFPIALGNGVDYSVNIVRRYADEIEKGTDRIRAVRESVEGTGGAVILCSLTTVIGYISIHTSSNRALQSFGMATAIAEVTTLGSAVVVLPAVLYLLGRRRERLAARRSAAPSAV